MEKKENKISFLDVQNCHGNYQKNKTLLLRWCWWWGGGCCTVGVSVIGSVCGAVVHHVFDCRYVINIDRTSAQHTTDYIMVVTVSRGR